MKHRLATFIAAGNRGNTGDSQALWSELYGPAPSDHFLEISERVLLDIDATCNGAHIMGDGELVFDPDNSRTLTVDAHGFMVMDGGKLTMAPANPAVVHKLRFINVVEQDFTAGGDIDDIDHHVNPGLMVMDATITLRGAEKTGWTRTTHALLTGATTCTVVDATGWRVGDEIVITPTEPRTVTGHTTHFDRRTITNVAGNTISFAATTYPHPLNTSPSGVVIGAEVLNLTRNVIIEGQDATHRPHTMFMGDCTGSVFEYFEGRFLGPRKLNLALSPAPMLILGRYGLHFHKMGEGSRGLHVKGVSMHDLGSRAFVPHGSHGMTFTDCVAWSCFSEGYWWDINPGGELIDESNDLLYDHCFAGRVLFSDTNPGGFQNSGFFMSAGVNITCRNCCVAAVDGTTDTSGYHWPESLNNNNHNFWTFEDNDAHNVKESGVFIWQNDGNKHVLTRFRGWNNIVAGIDFGAYLNVYHFEDCETWDNNPIADFFFHPNSHFNTTPAGYQIEIRGGHTGQLRINSHRLPTEAPSLFIDTVIEHITVVENQAFAAGLLDFVDCGITADDVSILGVDGTTMHTDSVYRIQNGGTAQQVVSLDGLTLTVTSIPVFYPY